MRNKKTANLKKLPKNYMDIVYIRSKKWNMNKKGFVEVEMENRGFTNRIAQKFFHKPKISYIELDTYGTVLWKAIDGNKTVYDLIQLMEKEFPNEKDRMLDRVVSFLSTLKTNHFINEKEEQ